MRTYLHTFTYYFFVSHILTLFTVSLVAFETLRSTYLLLCLVHLCVSLRLWYIQVYNNQKNKDNVCGCTDRQMTPIHPLLYDDGGDFADIASLPPPYAQ